MNQYSRYVGRRSRWCGLRVDLRARRRGHAPAGCRRPAGVREGALGCASYASGRCEQGSRPAERTAIWSRQAERRGPQDRARDNAPAMASSRQMGQSVGGLAGWPLRIVAPSSPVPGCATASSRPAAPSGWTWLWVTMSCPRNAASRANSSRNERTPATGACTAARASAILRPARMFAGGAIAARPVRFSFALT